MEIKDLNIEDNSSTGEFNELSIPKSRKSRSDKGKKRGSKNSESNNSDNQSSDIAYNGTCKLLVKVVTDYFGKRDERWYATNDEIELLGNTIADVAKKYLPDIEAFKEEIALVIVAGGYFGTRMMNDKPETKLKSISNNEDINIRKNG
jgi:hypothetical protein